MIRNFFNRIVLCGSVIATFVPFASCGGAKVEKAESESVAAKAPEEFHADNDIAMTLGSLVDALHVGESIDSTTYAYTGVLTDGVGRPLYTVLDGTPGEWTVRVVSPTNAVISTTEVGDLPAADLESYILSSLGSPKLIMERDHNGGIIKVYEMSDTEIMSIESRTVTDKSGLEGTEMTIGVSSHERYIDPEELERR